MIKQVFRTLAALSLVAFAGQASADMISSSINSASSANFSWQITDKGHLLVTVQNTSTTGAIIGGMLFGMSGGSVDYLSDVDGTGGDGAWRQVVDNSGICSTSTCVSTRGNANAIHAGTMAHFRFVGDFTGLQQLSGVWVSFKTQDGRSWGYGCDEGCDPYAVPEPGMLVLFGTGLLGMGVAWRRRQRAIA